MSVQLTELETKTLDYYWNDFGLKHIGTYEKYEDDSAECVMCDGCPCGTGSDFKHIASTKVMRGVLTSLNKKGILFPDDVNGQYNAWFVTEEGFKIMQGMTRD